MRGALRSWLKLREAHNSVEVPRLGEWRVELCGHQEGVKEEGVD